MSANREHIVVGQFGAPHGIKGFIKVQSFTRPEQNLFDYQPWFVKRQGQWQEIPLKTVERHAKRWVVQLENVEDRTKAQSLTGLTISVLREALPEPETGSYYWNDLIGLTVQSKQGQALGKVKDFLETGANDVMIVQKDKEELLIPFVFEHYILEISLERGEIIVDWVIED
jgi:16S rRNA processing protein RimM